jgi:hypothetical protein
MYTTKRFKLQCIISEVDGNKYCVRDRNQLSNAVDLLAQVTNKCKKLVFYMKENHPTDSRVKRLVKNFRPNKISEILPTSKFTAYSENKGEKIALCLTIKKKGSENLIDEHTLMFVAIHELTHIMTVSIGHEKEFWDNFKFLLQNAKRAGIHEPIDYSKSPVEYCSLQITDSPYF